MIIKIREIRPKNTKNDIDHDDVSHDDNHDDYYNDVYFHDVQPVTFHHGFTHILKSGGFTVL